MYNDYRYDSDDIKKLTFDMFLMRAPSIVGLYKFSIKFVLSDGRVLEQETDEIELH